MQKKSVSFHQGNDDVCHLQLRAPPPPPQALLPLDCDAIALSSRRSSCSSQDTCSGAMDDMVRVAAAAKALVLCGSLSPTHGAVRFVVSPTATRPNDDSAEASFRSHDAIFSNSPPLYYGRGSTHGGAPADPLQRTVRPRDINALLHDNGAYGNENIAGLDISMDSKSASANKWQLTSFCSQGTFVEHRCTPLSASGGGGAATPTTSCKRHKAATEQYAVAVQVAKQHQHRSIKELLRQGCQRMLMLEDNEDDE